TLRTNHDLSLLLEVYSIDYRYKCPPTAKSFREVSRKAIRSAYMADQKRERLRISFFHPYLLLILHRFYTFYNQRYDGKTSSISSHFLCTDQNSTRLNS